ncbi:DUF4340 domain-containing protein [Synechococcales cyanobacterium C]|uniref:DUF4340 domain-containing protein n=1 Tax=Petrachloros mirabilis ULC683 TaxID=2781853 RepID=A0A8K2A2P6_9CYAN|nr:DUF4340 domain-containing protein [Petrachloros mirabilis]NCJ08552.1 DUF4340 domain-containing protein [Petrachloros mirabilis ULC683]
MKLKINTLVLLLVALGFGVGVWAWEQWSPVEDTADSSLEMGEPLFSFSEDDIEQIEVRTADLDIQFERTADTFPQVWTIRAPIQAPADEGAIAFLLSQLTTGRRDRTLEIPTSQLAEFGLEPPTATVDVTLNTQARHQLILGGADFSRNFTYVRIDPDGANGETLEIHLAPFGLLDAVDRSLSEWQQPPEAAEATPESTPEAAPKP